MTNFIKKYEKFINKDLDKLIDLSKIKKFIVTKFDNDYFLDEIIEIYNNDDNIKLKTRVTYDSDNDSLIKHQSEYAEMHFDYFNDVLYTSDDYNDAEIYFDNIVKMYKNSNKYNL